MASLFERLGRKQVEAYFQAILDKCRDIYRNDLLAKIADGEYAWEDYVEHDGVTDPKLHKLALKMIKKGDRITFDFNRPSGKEREQKLSHLKPWWDFFEKSFRKINAEREGWRPGLESNQAVKTMRGFCVATPPPGQ